MIVLMNVPRKLKPHLQPKDVFERLYELANFSLAIERIPVGEALNRITAQDIYAINNGPNHSVTMKDGIMGKLATIFRAAFPRPVHFCSRRVSAGQYGDTGLPPHLILTVMQNNAILMLMAVLLLTMN